MLLQGQVILGDVYCVNYPRQASDDMYVLLGNNVQEVLPFEIQERVATTVKNMFFHPNLKRVEVDDEENPRFLTAEWDDDEEDKEDKVQKAAIFGVLRGTERCMSNMDEVVDGISSWIGDCPIAQNLLGSKFMATRVADAEDGFLFSCTRRRRTARALSSFMGRRRAIRASSASPPTFRIDLQTGKVIGDEDIEVTRWTREEMPSVLYTLSLVSDKGASNWKLFQKSTFLPYHWDPEREEV